MAHDKVYGFCENKCKVEVPAKKDLEIIRNTLAAGETELTIVSDRITENSALSFYTSIYGVSPTAVVITAGLVTLTFDVQEVDLEVGVRIDG